MKFKYLLIPLFTLIATSCNGVSDITSLDSGSESSLSEEDDSSGEITSTSASTEGEIDYATLNDFFGFDIYSLIPKIYSNDYEFFDDSSVDFPIDIYIYLFDWSEADAVAYDESLAANLPVNEDYGYVLQENTYTYVYFYDDDFGNTVFYINLFTVNDGGTTPIDPGETSIATLTSIYDTNYDSEIPDGIINEHLNIVNGSTVVVTFAANSSTVRTIFNNASGEIRLYAGDSNNGGALTITSDTAITAVTVNTSQNGGYSINGGAVVTAASFKTVLSTSTNSLTIQNISSSQVRIISIEVEFAGGSSNTNPDEELPLGTTSLIPNLVTLADYQVDTFAISATPSTGEHNVLVVPIEIYGDPFPSDYLTKLDLLFNGTSASTGWQSVASYYALSSYGQLDFTFEIVSKFTTPSTQDASFYQAYEDYGDEFAIVEALNSMGSTDFTQYDDNNDGLLDSVVFIYSTDYSYDYDPWWAWVFSGQYFEYHATPVLDGKELGRYVWASYDFMFDNTLSNPVTVNAETYIHEFGHLLGLPDLYKPDAVGPLGSWDMMDFNCGDHGPFNKLMLGWVNPLIAGPGYSYEVTLDSYSLDQDGENSVLLIPRENADFSDNNAYDEYLLIMYYTPDGIYDGHLDTPFSVSEPGIVIYHIDARLASNADEWDLFMNNNTGTGNFLAEILEVDKNNSIPSENTLISNSDLLLAGAIDLASYSWNQGGSIYVGIEIVSLTSINATLTVDVY
ncbi:MAG: hypothetical protein RBR36_03850 [Bacilli bacterium]|nr:hypothetical protein [Bacilli bacterium]